MDNVQIVPADTIGGEFVAAEYRVQGDELAVRDSQFQHADRQWRRLTRDERKSLSQNGNRCDDWNRVLVCDPFDPGLIRGSAFHGMVRLGRMEAVALQHHDMRLPVGITDSLIISSDVGDLAAIHGVRYLAHYVIGDRCMIANVDEMHTTERAKFGNGILKDGETEDDRRSIDLVNETGSRRISPFDGMLPADAYIWSRYRDDQALQVALLELTQKRHDSRRGYYGTTGEQTVIKNCGIIKDVKIGSHCYVKGANKLKNLTINSSEREPSQIGEGVELVNGIVGYGCRVFYGCKAVRFILGSNCQLKYGARLIHSFLGDNSTVSCCEILNNLIFPAHEQHHNNSFLIASLVLGQSNIAAGATIGSNHNSRANDNEIQAGRGFWPGLNTSLRHSSRFASYVLIAKGSYPNEMDIRLPFSLVSNDAAKDRLEVMPAYWWLYNMYALARNERKFQARDTRVVRAQHIEFRSLAPDTIEEIILARGMLEVWTGHSASAGGDPISAEATYASVGHRLLTGHPADMQDLCVFGSDMERGPRDTIILKARDGYEAYGQMLHHYAATNLVAYLSEHEDEDFDELRERFDGPRCQDWVNLGGQLVPEQDVDELRRDIGTGGLTSWDEIHGRYDSLWQAYPVLRARHAYAVFVLLQESERPDLSDWTSFLEGAIYLQELVRDRVVQSREKDYTNPFRRATYRNEAEMIAALGTIDENSFVKQVRSETEAYVHTVERLLNRG